MLLLYGSPVTGPTTSPASWTVSFSCPASWLGLSDAVVPPAMDVYRRKTARAAATPSATTSRAGLRLRATARF